MKLPGRSSPATSLDAASQAHGQRVEHHLRQCLQRAGGWLRFETYMQEALYAPGLGYYAAGSRKLASTTDAASRSDFITAPELSPWFGLTLAGPVADILNASGSNRILELGAGSGALAAQLIPALRVMGLDPQYAILEVSADLKQRQQQRLAEFAPQIQWLDALPSEFDGCILANEVLDAMPVRLFRWGLDGELLERGVTWHDDRWQWLDLPADATLRDVVLERVPALPNYVSEINQQAEAWMLQLGDWLRRGGAILIDYGFPQPEYYHPQRHEGTLMCHFRHTSHADPLRWPGLQDITAHVDFTAMADAAMAGGLDVLGYNSQAAFLLDAGLLQHLRAFQQQHPERYLRQLNSVQKLISEAEMGELFKVLVVGRDIETPRGFRKDRLHTL